MKFGYKKVQKLPDPAFPNAYSTYPVIPVELTCGGKHIGIESLLDSGFDHTLFPASIGAIIGISVDKGKRVPTISGVGGGHISAYFQNVDVFIGGNPFTLYCGFSPEIPASGLGPFGGILGRNDFFDQFVVKFYNRDGRVEIQRLSK